MHHSTLRLLSQIFSSFWCLYSLLYLPNKNIFYMVFRMSFQGTVMYMTHLAITTIPGDGSKFKLVSFSIPTKPSLDPGSSILNCKSLPFVHAFCVFLSNCLSYMLWLSFYCSKTFIRSLLFYTNKKDLSAWRFQGVP